MAEVPNIPFLSVQWLMDKTGQSRTDMLSQTLPGLEIPLYGDARGRECFGFPESYSEREAWDIVFFECSTSKKYVFRKAPGDGNPAADSWVKSVFISRNDVIKIFKALNLLAPEQQTAQETQDDSRRKKTGTGSKAQESGAERQEINNEILLGMLFHAINNYKYGLQGALLDSIEEMFKVKTDGNENSRGKLNQKIPEWKKLAERFKDKNHPYW